MLKSIVFNRSLFDTRKIILTLKFTYICSISFCNVAKNNEVRVTYCIHLKTQMCKKAFSSNF